MSTNPPQPEKGTHVTTPEAGAYDILAALLLSTDRPETLTEARMTAAGVLGIHAREIAAGHRPAIEQGLASPRPTAEILATVSALAPPGAVLRAAADEFRALFGEFVIKGRDGNWANVADWIATRARIPACGAFYPPATDTRCTRAKGHRGSHNAPWGMRDMAWPYDPRETTQPPLTAEELATAQADVDHLNAEFPDEPQDGNGWPGDEHAEPGTRGWTV